MDQNIVSIMKCLSIGLLQSLENVAKKRIITGKYEYFRANYDFSKKNKEKIIIPEEWIPYYEQFCSLNENILSNTEEEFKKHIFLGYLWEIWKRNEDYTLRQWEEEEKYTNPNVEVPIKHMEAIYLTIETMILSNSTKELLKLFFQRLYLVNNANTQSISSYMQDPKILLIFLKEMPSFVQLNLNELNLSANLQIDFHQNKIDSLKKEILKEICSNLKVDTYDVKIFIEILNLIQYNDLYYDYFYTIINISKQDFKVDDIKPYILDAITHKRYLQFKLVNIFLSESTIIELWKDTEYQKLILMKKNLGATDVIFYVHKISSFVEDNLLLQVIEETKSLSHDVAKIIKQRCLDKEILKFWQAKEDWILGQIGENKKSQDNFRVLSDIFVKDINGKLNRKEKLSVNEIKRFLYYDESFTYWGGYSNYSDEELRIIIPYGNSIYSNPTIELLTRRSLLELSDFIFTRGSFAVSSLLMDGEVKLVNHYESFDINNLSKKLLREDLIAILKGHNEALIAISLQALLQKIPHEEIERLLPELSKTLRDRGSVQYASIEDSDSFPKLSHTVPNAMPAEDLPYFLYRKQFKGNIPHSTLKEFMEWCQTYWPEKTQYRDALSMEFFADKFESLAQKEQLEFLNFFKDNARNSILRKKYYDQYKQEHSSSLQESLKFLLELYPEPSLQRDLLIESILSNHPISTEKFLNEIQHLYSRNSEEYRRKESVAHGFLVIDESKPNEKADTILWLCEKIDKPKIIINKENLSKANLDELKLSMKEKSFRDEILEEYFLGNQGLLTKENIQKCKRVVNSLLQDFIVESSNDSENIKKLKQLIQVTLDVFLESNDQNKKFTVIKGLFDAFFEKKVSLETMIFSFLSSYGGAGIKLAQILSSRPEIKRAFPDLHQILSKTKEETNPMSYKELMTIIYATPSLRGKTIVVKERIGSASIKGAFLVIIDGKEYVIKARRMEAERYLKEEEKNFDFLMKNLIPRIQEIFKVDYVPNYTDRVFGWLREEVDFSREMQNSQKFSVNVENSDIKGLTVPKIHQNLSGTNIIVEELAKGQSLEQYLNDKKTTEQEKTQILSKIKISLLVQILKDKFFHGDPHFGNIFFDKESGEISFIDLGMMGEVTKETQIVIQELIRSFSGGNTQEIYQSIFLKLVPKELITKRIQDKIVKISQKPIKEQPLEIVSLLDSIEGYTPPEDLIRLFIAISKADFLFDNKISIGLIDKFKIFNYLKF